MSQRTVLPEKLTVAQLLIQFLVFYRTCRSIPIFTTARLTPSHPIPLAHLSSVLTYILHWTTSLLQPICLVHLKRHVDTTKWGMKSETLTNHGTSNLTYWSYINTTNNSWSSKLKPQQIYPKTHILHRTPKQKLRWQWQTQPPKLSCLYKTGTSKTLT
jgi:hypothetical protein